MWEASSSFDKDQVPHVLRSMSDKMHHRFLRSSLDMSLTDESPPSSPKDRVGMGTFTSRDDMYTRIEDQGARLTWQIDLSSFSRVQLVHLCCDIFYDLGMVEVCLCCGY